MTNGGVLNGCLVEAGWFVVAGIAVYAGADEKSL